MWKSVSSLQKSRWWMPILLCFFAIIPLGMVLDQMTPEEGLIPVLQFGERWKKRQIPSVKTLDVATPTKFGYDGQFYAQIAQDPTLGEVGIDRALDRPRYRSRRIGLPTMAHILALGQTWWVLQIYAALNLVFWFFLFFILWKKIGFKSVRDILLGVSLLWTTGTLVSVSKALTDLPAAVISLTAIIIQGSGWVWVILLSVAALVKETTILSFTPVISTFNKNGLFKKESWIQASLLFLPLAFWSVYVQWVLPPSHTSGLGNFSLPFAGIYQKLVVSLETLGAIHEKQLVLNIESCFELVCLLSLIIQAAYMATKPKWSEKIWLYGIGFVFLFSILGPSVLVEQFAYTRVLLPMTFSFNLLLHKFEKQSYFYYWFIAGNFGLGVFAFQFLLSLR